MEEIQRHERNLLSLLDSECNGGNDASYVEDIQNGKFMKVLKTRKCEEIYCRYLHNYTSEESLDILLQKSLNMYIDHEYTTLKEQLEVLCMGIASLHAFIQSNWTGPPLEVDSVSSTCILPWLYSWHGGRALQDEITACLILDGESCCPVMKHPELLLLARVTMQVCSDRVQPLHSSQWWLMRCLFVQQQILDEFSPILHNSITALMEDLLKCEPLMIKEHSQICYYLEAAQIHLYYRHVSKSYEYCKMAKKAANMEVELTGALGKRTRFQLRELAQLTVKVSVTENNRSESVPTTQLQYLPKDLILDDEVRLNKIKFTDDSAGEFSDLQPVEQAVLLGIFVQTQKSQPKDKLADEELLPYLTCLLSHPLSWSLQVSALLQRCRLEGHHSRTVERAMMQTEELVNCFNKEKPDVVARHYYFFCSHLPPSWKIEIELANLLISIGVVKSALDIFLRLQLWEDVIACYNLLHLRHKAVEIIQQELKKKETVKLWCLLGDATDDPTCYEKAWKLSNYKSGRAQRHWGLYYFNRKQYAESIPHIQESLAINSLQVTLWFHLGYAALDQEDWSLCATAYQRYCSLDPESFEAWNNLSKAYVKLNQKLRAWMTLQEALKWNFENWRVWDNYMVVSTDIGKFQEVIQAYNRILDLKEKHVDIEVLEILVNALNKSDSVVELKKKAEQLFTRLTQQVRNNTALWQLFVRLMLTNTENETFESLEKIISCLHKAFWSAIQDSHFERDPKECSDVIEITSQLIDATLKCSKECSRNERKLQMLASAKLCLQTLIARIKKCHGEVPEEEVLVSSLQDLQVKLEIVVAELQRHKSSV